MIFFVFFPRLFGDRRNSGSFQRIFGHRQKFLKKSKYLYLHSPSQSYPSLTLHGVVFSFFTAQAAALPVRPDLLAPLHQLIRISVILPFFI